jgi:pimeloyl-ACP methyl ester carboxylesterase
MWDDQVEAFSRKYEVIRYDVRGFGRSSPGTSEPFSSVDDLKGLLDILDHRSAHVVGLSMGGGIATSFAAVYPEATLSLVPVDSNLWGFRFTDDWNAFFSGLGPIAARQGVDAAKEVWLSHPLFGPANERPVVASRLKAIVGDWSGWHLLNEDGERGLNPPTTERLGDVNAPTLVVLGDRDVTDFHVIADRLSREIPNARKVILPGVGHMSNMEDPETFNRIVLAFLASMSQH